MDEVLDLIGTLIEDIVFRNPYDPYGKTVLHLDESTRKICFLEQQASLKSVVGANKYHTQSCMPDTLI